MCRILGAVAQEPTSLRHELLEAENPFVRQSEAHDSGWGSAVYERAEGAEPALARFDQAAFEDPRFEEAVDARGRIFNCHVRRATLGGLCLENTHPFALGPFTFSHNGTIIRYPKFLERGVSAPAGDTDSEAFFNFLMRDFDDGHPVRSLRRAVRGAIDRSPFSGLNFLFSDGERLFAYRLGIFELHWHSDGNRLLVASERSEPGGKGWHTVAQDVLLVCDPASPEEPHAVRLAGDEWVERATIEKYEEATELRGAERGAYAAERAKRLASAANR
ncbi:MAG: class II glutamine amidotransferase [Thermoleophilaceae bacterium]|nr:class II glutamine amidotransferase [Thermoleophilaceae bacterium]